MSEAQNPGSANAAAEVADAKAKQILAEIAAKTGGATTEAAAATLGAAEKGAEKALTELRALLEARNITDVAKMVELARIPGVIDQLNDKDKALIASMSGAYEDVPEPPATSAKPAKKVHPKAAPAKSEKRTATPEKAPVAPASPAETVEVPTEEKSPFESMSRKEFDRRVSEVMAADAAAARISEAGVNVVRSHHEWLAAAYKERANPGQMQEVLADAIANALDIRTLKKAGTERDTIKAENKQIADRIAEKIVNIEENPEPKRGLAALWENVRTAPGKGVRRVLNGLGNYYNHSVDAVAGRRSASEQEEVEVEKKYSDEDEKKLTEFITHIRRPKIKKHIGAQLKKLKNDNALPDVSTRTEAAADTAEKMTPEDAAAKRALLDKIAEAQECLIEITSFDPDIADADEDLVLENPDVIVNLLELLNELNISIDTKKRGAETVDGFMPAVTEEEDTEDDEVTQTKEVGFWQRVQFWNKGKREADNFVDETADLTFVGIEIDKMLKALKPKDVDYKKKRAALLKAKGLAAQVQLAEEHRDANEGVKRDHKPINELRKELVKLGIPASEDAADALAADARAEADAEAGVDASNLSTKKKNWLKERMKDTGKFLRSPAFLLGVATGATTDLLLHVMGADPQNKMWIRTGIAGFIGESVFSQFTRGKLATAAQRGGIIGLAARSLFWTQDLGVRLGGQHLATFMIGFSGGAIGANYSHGMFDSLTQGMDISLPDFGSHQAVPAGEAAPVASAQTSEVPQHVGQNLLETYRNAGAGEPAQTGEAPHITGQNPLEAYRTAGAGEPAAAPAESLTQAEMHAAAQEAKEAVKIAEFNKGTQEGIAKINELMQKAAQQQEAAPVVPVQTMEVVQNAVHPDETNQQLTESVQQTSEQVAQQAQGWAARLGDWWREVVAQQPVAAREATPVAPAPVVKTEHEKLTDAFYSGLAAEKTADITANVHDGSSVVQAPAVTTEHPAPTQAQIDAFNKGTQEGIAKINELIEQAAQQQKVEPAAAAAPAQITETPQHVGQDPHETYRNAGAGEPATAPVVHAENTVHDTTVHTVSSTAGGNAHEVGSATIVASTPVEQHPVPTGEVIKFDSENIWRQAEQVTGGDGNRTDFLKDVGVMIDHAGTGNHEHRAGDQVIVINDTVHTVADLQALHAAHPEAVGFKLPDDDLKLLDAFYQEAAKTDPAQRSLLQQDVIKYFTGGMSGEDLAKNPAAIEAMLKIAHGEVPDGSQHIIATEQVAAPVEVSGQQTETAQELLEQAVKEYNLDLKHPLAAQGVIDHMMHEMPDNNIDHPELIARFVDNIWGKWVDACHQLSLDPMKAPPRIVDYITNPGYDGKDPLQVSPVRAVMINYIQHGDSMADLSMTRGAGETVTLNLDTAHAILAKVDDNPFIGQLITENGPDGAMAQLNIEDIFKNDADEYYKRIQNKSTP